MWLSTIGYWKTLEFQKAGREFDFWPVKSSQGCEITETRSLEWMFTPRGWMEVWKKVFRISVSKSERFQAF